MKSSLYMSIHTHVFLPCNHVQAFDLLEMLKKEEEMLQAFKERQSQVFDINICVLLMTCVVY